MSLAVLPSSVNLTLSLWPFLVYLSLLCWEPFFLLPPCLLSAVPSFAAWAHQALLCLFRAFALAGFTVAFCGERVLLPPLLPAVRSSPFLGQPLFWSFLSSLLSCETNPFPLEVWSGPPLSLSGRPFFCPSSPKFLFPALYGSLLCPFDQCNKLKSNQCQWRGRLSDHPAGMINCCLCNGFVGW